MVHIVDCIRFPVLALRIANYVALGVPDASLGEIITGTLFTTLLRHPFAKLLAKLPMRFLPYILWSVFVGIELAGIEVELARIIMAAGVAGGTTRSLAWINELVRYRWEQVAQLQTQRLHEGLRFSHRNIERLSGLGA